MTAAEALGLIATFLYALSSLLRYRQFRGQAAPSRAVLMLPGGLAVATYVTKLQVPVIYSIFVRDLKLIRWKGDANS